MNTYRTCSLLLAALVGVALEARAGFLAGSGDPFTFNFDENGNGQIDLRNGFGFQNHQGFLAPDPTQASNPLVLTYSIPALPFPVVNGDVRIWEDFGGSHLSEVLRFTDAAGNLTGQTADRMLYYSEVEPGEFHRDLADTGLPGFLLPNDAGGIIEIGPEGNNGFQWAPGGPLDNVFNGISDVPEPATLALLGLGPTVFLLARWPKKEACRAVAKRRRAFPLGFPRHPNASGRRLPFKGDLLMTCRQTRPHKQRPARKASRWCGVRCPWLSLTCLTLATHGPSAHAFNIALPARHTDITDAASRAAGWNRAAREQLIGNVVDVDTMDAGANLNCLFPPRIHPTATYSADHHFDRNPGVTHANAFKAGASYVRGQLVAAQTEAVAGDGRAARLEAARGLHALEDLFAHSNFVDLNAADRTTVIAAVWDGTVAPPGTLLMTGYHNAPPDCSVAGLPAADVRAHDNFALDRVGFNAYSGTVINVGGVMDTRHGHARTFAIAAATDFLGRLNAALNAADRKTLRVADASEPAANEASYQWAALQPYDTNGFTVSFSGNSVVFPSMDLDEPVRAGLLGASVYVVGHDDVVGHDEEALFAPTGERLAIFREIRPVTQAFASPLQVRLRYDSDEVLGLEPGTLRVFFADPNGESWVPVPASISESLHEADFSATNGGIYAIGGVEVILNKWEQSPDAGTNGLDVRATVPKVLADDFLCTATGPITQIRIWGSWLNDLVAPQPCFCLGVWSDVPGAGSQPSHPGVQLWTNCFFAGQYTYLSYPSGVNAWFYEPCALAGASGVLGSETAIWEYTFDIPTNRVYWQTNGTIYWLSVSANCSDTNTSLFGWKTCPTNWNDTAVCGRMDALGNPLGDWQEMRRPGTTNNLDLAFAITTTRNAPSVPVVPPVLSVQQANGTLTIVWPGGGRLQCAPEVTGPWTTIHGASCPYVVPLNMPRCFYRVVVP